MSFRHATTALVLSLAAAPLACSSPAADAGRPAPADAHHLGYAVQADSAWYALPCGAVLASFDGTNAYSNGAYTGTGTACNGYGAFGLEFQCVELVMRHFQTHWGLSWLGNAADLLANAPRDAVDVFYNGDGAHPPMPGDMITWNDTPWGHVALVTAVSSEGIEIIQQNVWGAGGIAVLPWDGATVYGPAGWGWALPQGWAHAKANGAAASGGGGGGCSSATLGRDVGEGTCVQSASDAQLYVCQGGGWNAVGGCPAGSDDWGYCYATHADQWVPATSCSRGSDGVWYQCGEHAEWLGGVGNGAGPVGACSRYVY